MERLIWSSQMENFRGKRDFLKGRPKFLNGSSKRKLCVPFALSDQFQAFRIGSLGYSARFPAQITNMAASQDSQMFQCGVCGLLASEMSLLVSHEEESAFCQSDCLSGLCLLSLPPGSVPRPCFWSSWSVHWTHPLTMRALWPRKSEDFSSYPSSWMELWNQTV